MKIRRGNYKIIKFQRKNKNGEVITDLPDKMYFSVKNNFDEKDTLFQKKLNDGITYDEETNYYFVELKQDDTEGLDYGTYDYDIKIIYGTDKPKTLIVDKLEITEVVTRKDNEV